MIDLHLHSTASDGALSPAAVVLRAQAAGLHTVSLTDHDTVSGLAEARAAAEGAGIRFVPGIEITSVEDGRDVHLLGYWFDEWSERLRAFLERQRIDRLRRVRDICGRLAALGYDIDEAGVLARATPGRSIGRPQIADALVAAGYAADRTEAFDRWLAQDRPAFVPRRGPGPEAAIEEVRAAGGITSLAHPGLLGMDALISRLAGAGLTALEVCHSDHDAEAERRYRDLAARFALAVSGGSDYHGDEQRRGSMLGRITMTPDELTALEARRA